MKKKILGIIIVLTLLLTSLTIPNYSKAKTTDTNKGYLVLVRSGNTWIAYDGLVCKSPKNNLMVKAYNISKVLDLKYSKPSAKTITIVNGKKKLTFTKETTTYKYYNGKKTVSINAAYKAYTSKAFVNQANVIHYSTIANLSIYTKYYTGSKSTSYKVNGYQGVICYSKTKFSELPDINKVINTNGDTLVEDNNDDEDSEPTQSGESITIEGVKVPVLSEFAEDAITGDYWGIDVPGNKPGATAVSAVGDKLSEVLESHNNAMDGDSAIQIYENSVVYYMASTLDAIMELVKSDNCYELTLYTHLDNSGLDKSEYYLSGLHQSALKAIISLIVPDVNSVYNAIYSHWEEDNTNNINKTSWTTIGNVEIKYNSVGGHGVYYIKK